MDSPNGKRVVAGGLPAAELQKWVLQKWLDQHPTWSGPTRRMGINVVMTMMNWGVSQQYISAHQLKGFKKPRDGVRANKINAGQVDAVIAAVRDGDRFKDFVTALKLTGARPSEVRRVTAADFREPGLWVLEFHKNSKKTDEPRTIFLCPEMVEMTRRLVGENPEGALFRNNRDGAPWKAAGIARRFYKLKKKLGFPVSPYLFRSYFCTSGLLRGVDVAHMCALLGHKGTTMVMRHYNDIAGQIGHMLDVAAKAVS